MNGKKKVQNIKIYVLLLRHYLAGKSEDIFGKKEKTVS
jgi:hypothetical protein